MLNISSPKSPQPFGSNCYILSSSGECCVIDPSVPYSPELFDGEMKYIILTHCHFDHILEVDSWKNNTNAKVIVSVDDGASLSDPGVNCYRTFFNVHKGYFGEYSAVCDGDILTLGDKLLKFISCPGHTKGSVAILCDDVCFVGDTVFAGGGYGRFDLPGGDYSKLCESIEKILSLPDCTTLYCGHGPTTTIGDYKKFVK